MSEEIKQNGQLSSANFAIKTEDYKSYTPYMVYDKKMQEKDQNIIILKVENKRLREALIEIARIEPSPIFSYSSKDIDKICIIAEQALGGTCD